MKMKGIFITYAILFKIMTYSDIPALVEKEINALIKANYYPSMSEAIKDAFRTLFEAKPNLRITSARLLYKIRKYPFQKLQRFLE